MAKKQIVGVGLLPSGRAVRVAKLDVPLMQEMTRRVARKFPTKEGEQEPTRADVSIEMENVLVELCVRGYTPAPVKLVYKERPATPDEIKAGSPAAIKTVDVGATLAPYIDPESDEFKRWVSLTEMQLSNDEDDCSKFALFGDPTEWRALIDRINSNGGGGGADPFVGALVKTSAG